MNGMGDPISDRIADLERRVVALEARQSFTKTMPKPPSRDISISEWVRGKRPRGAVETAVVIGVYLESQRKLLAFTQEDLKSGFREAKEPVPVNLAETINKNIKKSHLMETLEKKEGMRLLKVTNSGESFVDSLPRGAK